MAQMSEKQRQAVPLHLEVIRNALQDWSALALPEEVLGALRTALVIVKHYSNICPTPEDTTLIGSSGPGVVVRDIKGTPKLLYEDNAYFAINTEQPVDLEDFFMVLDNQPVPAPEEDEVD